MEVGVRHLRGEFEFICAHLCYLCQNTRGSW